ncbi:MAG TPA: hypothetical protein PLI90_01505, partial [Rhodocyclaceae bacterium]|nr:hypothetical protein [Rhodocyclaceae bacterium]
MLFDENIVCPITGEPLDIQNDGWLASPSDRRYAVIDGIPAIFVEGEGSSPDGPAESSGRAASVTQAVQDFYKVAPFPNYNSFDSIASFVKQADAGVFARLLRQQILPNSNVLEIGCGTAQLSNYLAA